MGIWTDENIQEYTKLMQEHNITVPMAIDLLEKSMARGKR